MAMNKIPCMYGKEMKVVTHDKFKTMTKKKNVVLISFTKKLPKGNLFKNYFQISTFRGQFVFSPVIK